MLGFLSYSLRNPGANPRCRNSPIPSAIVQNTTVTPAGPQRPPSTVARHSSNSTKPHRVNWYRARQERGRRWGLILIAGVGYYGYSKLSREIEELKSVVRAINVDGTGARISGYSNHTEGDNAEGEKFEHWERRWRGFPRMKNGDVGASSQGKL